MKSAEHNIIDLTMLSTIEQLEAESGGRICFAMRELSSGNTLRYRGAEKCKTASMIKLPMLVHVAMAAQEGALSWEEPLILTSVEKVGGSGVLTQLTDGLSLSIRDICKLMTIVSDNTGTNMIIERLGVEPINDRCRALGLEQTTLFRKAFTADTAESAQFGFGVTTADEMCELMTYIVEGADAGEAAFCETLQTLGAQFYRDCIPRYLPSTWKYAGKTGAIDSVRNDVGLVTTDDGRRFALAVFCQELSETLWTADNRGVVAIARIAKLLLT